MPPADSHCLKTWSSSRTTRSLDGLCVLARLSSFQRTDGSAPVTPYPTFRSSHRPGPAWKASPPVGRGAFRGTLRGYYRPLPVSTLKLPAPKINRRVRVELERDARARNCCV